MEYKLCPFREEKSEPGWFGGGFFCVVVVVLGCVLSLLF